MYLFDVRVKKPVQKSLRMLGKVPNQVRVTFFGQKGLFWVSPFFGAVVLLGAVVFFGAVVYLGAVV